MFEQSLYNLEPAEPTREGDFLHDYEIKSWDLGPRIYQIIGAAALVNILFIVIAGQGSLLTAKTCDSPLVGRVCQVLDTVYVGTVLFGTEREYVDVAYEKTDLGDADITFVDVSGVEPPLDYPAGYFQLANPEDFAMRQQMSANPTLGFPGFPNPTTPDSLINTTPSLPKANPNVIDGTLPSIDTPGDSTIATSRKGRPGGRIKTPSDSTVAANANTNSNSAGKPTADTKDESGDKVDPITGDVYNNRPWADLADVLNGLITNGKFSLTTNFSVLAKVKLDKTGRFDPKTFKYSKADSPDPKMLQVVQESILAFNDSGRLKVLKDLGGKDLQFALSQDDEKVSAVVQSEVESDTRALSIKSSLDLLKSIAIKMKSDPNADANDKDDLLLLQNATIETNGKNIVIKFSLDKPVAQEMIERKLKEKLANQTPKIGNITGKSNDNTAKK